jgi:iron(III) transport system substrate-binding protein
VRAALRAIAATAAFVAGCGGSEVTVYTSADEAEVARPVLERFERETGIRVLAKTDSEATKTTGLANALRAERPRPRADVFWSNEQAANVALAGEGVTAPAVGPGAPADALARVADAWPARWRDPDGRWFAFAARARVAVCRSGDEASLPATWSAFAHPRLRGRIAMADPRFGTTRSHFGAMQAYWGRAAAPGYAEAFFAALAANRPKVLTSGNAGVIDAVARGEADVGMTDTDDALAAIARGLPIAFSFPRHAEDPAFAGGGTFAIPNTVALVAGGPHPEAARRFMEFMLAPATERQLASMPARHAPVVHPPADGDLVIPDPLEVDPVEVARAADVAVERFLGAVRSAVPEPAAPEPAASGAASR